MLERWEVCAALQVERVSIIIDVALYQLNIQQPWGANWVFVFKKGKKMKEFKFKTW